MRRAAYSVLVAGVLTVTSPARAVDSVWSAASVRAPWDAILPARPDLLRGGLDVVPVDGHEMLTSTACALVDPHAGASGIAAAVAVADSLARAAVAKLVNTHVESTETVTREIVSDGSGTSRVSKSMSSLTRETADAIVTGLVRVGTWASVDRTERCVALAFDLSGGTV